MLPVGTALRGTEMSPKQSRFFSDLVRKISRIDIDPSKVDFLQLRLSRRLRALGLETFEAYEELLRQDPSGPEIRHFVEALTTHTTSFFRERHQYDWLRDKGLTQLTADGAGLDRPFVVWSAACSTGAELWSAAMVLGDHAASHGTLRRIELVGTDISRAILKKAEGATYPEDEITGTAPEQCERYMMRSKGQFGTQATRLYRMVPELRRNARFAYANLTEPSSLPQLTADVVFLRNVLIYFEGDMQRQAIDGVLSRMRSGSALLTGHAEAIPSHPKLTSAAPSIYIKE